MTLDEAISSRKFFTLEEGIFALYPPVRTLRLFLNAGYIFVWQLVTKRRPALRKIGLTEEEIDAVVAELKKQDLRLRMKLDRILLVALQLGHSKSTKTGEYLHWAVPLLMEYCRENLVSDLTRELILIQRDMSRERIMAHRKNLHGTFYFEFTDGDGLPNFHSMGILAM